MKNLIEQFSWERLQLMISDEVFPVATIGEVQALARIALALQDAPGKIYHIRKTDGSEEWAEWLEVAEAEYYADVSNDGWERRILYTAPVDGMPCMAPISHGMPGGNCMCVVAIEGVVQDENCSFWNGRFYAPKYEPTNYEHDVTEIVTHWMQLPSIKKREVLNGC